MSRKITMVGSIVISILIVCTVYAVDITTKVNYEDTEATIGKIVYKGKYLTPVENFICVTTVFNQNGSMWASGYHTGIDLVGTINSGILSIDIGEVTYAGWQNSYGNCVEIMHKDDEENIFYSFYAHMQKDSICVSNGDRVELGQKIGVQGSTGNSTGDHLHFEIRLENKKAINPAPYLFTEI